MRATDLRAGLRQLAAFVAMLFTAYLTLATSCDEGFRDAELAGKTTLAAGESERRLAFVARVDGVIERVVFGVEPPVTFSVFENGADAGAGPIGDVWGDGSLGIDCGSRDCGDLEVVFMRGDFEGELELGVTASVTVRSGSCEGDAPTYIELEFQEAD
jgi:hypothetical protein